VWLENWLTTSFEGMALIVSHDSYFLNAVCTDVLELRSTLGGHKRGELTHYSGDYRGYEVQLEDRKKTQSRLKAAQEIQKDKLKEFISRDGKKYDGSGHQSQRKMKMKQLDNMDDIEEIEEESSMTFNIPEPHGHFANDEVLVGVERASFGWPGGEVLFEGVDFVVGPRARIGVIGKNGCG
jgi:ATP-binding cassette, subfamily F, member 3